VQSSSSRRPTQGRANVSRGMLAFVLAACWSCESRPSVQQQDAGWHAVTPPSSGLEDGGVRNDAETRDVRTTSDGPQVTGVDARGIDGASANLGSDGGTDSGRADGGELPCLPAPANERVLQVAVGGGQSCAILSGGVLKCWGIYGAQLGLGGTMSHGDVPNSMGANLPAVDLGTGRTAVSVSLGFEHTCVLLDDGNVKCFGGNTWGQLGLGDTNERGNAPGQMGDALPVVDLGAGRTAKAISAGCGHSCAILDDGDVKCWGSGESGALGLGDTLDRGDMPGQMGDALPTINLGTGRTAVAVSASSASGTGYGHTCAVLDDGSVKCWGYNDAGDLGLGDRVNRGDKPNEMGDALPTVDLGTGKTALAVKAGYVFTCALLDDQTVKCWGSGDFLGLGRIDSRGQYPGQMGDALPAVDLGTDRLALDLAAGYTSTCALLDDGHVKCWGMNFVGQLGIGDTMDRGTEPYQMGNYLPEVNLGACHVVSVDNGTGTSGGTAANCALLENGTLKCWGAGGELGIGDTMLHGESPDQMGDNLPTVKLFSDAW
jgi:alpha-tubulin suppressor-like RCC1 family protein